MLIRWKAWDADGKCYKSTDTCACHLPDTLQVVVQFTETGREFHTGQINPSLDRWYGFGEESIADAEGECPGGLFTWKRGTMIDDAKYNAITEEAYKSQWP